MYVLEMSLKDYLSFSINDIINNNFLVTAEVNPKSVVDKRKFRVTPYKDYLVSRKGEIYSLKRNIILSPRWDKDGYREVTLMDGKNTVSKTVHRLVADAWIPNPKHYPVVNHKNGNRDDNRVENLEWISISENNMLKNQNNGRKYIYDGNRINRKKSRLI